MKPKPETIKADLEIDGEPGVPAQLVAKPATGEVLIHGTGRLVVQDVSHDIARRRLLIECSRVEEETSDEPEELEFLDE